MQDTSKIILICVFQITQLEFLWKILPIICPPPKNKLNFTIKHNYWFGLVGGKKEGNENHKYQ